MGRVWNVLRSTLGSECLLTIRSSSLLQLRQRTSRRKNSTRCRATERYDASIHSKWYDERPAGPASVYSHVSHLCLSLYAFLSFLPPPHPLPFGIETRVRAFDGELLSSYYTSPSSPPVSDVFSQNCRCRQHIQLAAHDHALSLDMSTSIHSATKRDRQCIKSCPSRLPHRDRRRGPRSPVPRSRTPRGDTCPPSLYLAVQVDASRA